MQSGQQKEIPARTYEVEAPSDQRDIQRRLDDIDALLPLLTRRPMTPFAVTSMLNGTVVVRGDLLVGQGIPAKWVRYALSVPSSGTFNYLGVTYGETVPTWKSASSNPGVAARVLQSTSDGALTLQGLTVAGKLGAVINEDGDADADFRVESDTEANAILVDSSADAVYLGGSTNGLKVEKGGYLQLLGTATVWKDIDFPIVIRTTGAGIPSMATLNGNITMPQWAVNDFNVCESQEFIHEWKEGSTCYWHIHLTTNGLDATDRYVRFSLEYGYSAPSGAWVFPTAIDSGDLLIPANTTTKTMFILSIGSFTPTGGKIGGHAVAYLKRIASAGTAPSGNPWIPMLQMHVECDSLGSHEIASK